MSSRRFEGSANLADDMPDIHFLALTHYLVSIGELTPLQVAGRLTIESHKERFVVEPDTGLSTDTIAPVIHLGHVATHE